MLRTALCVAVLTASLPAQSIIPAKAGLVSYAGEAYIDDHPVEVSPTRFSAMNDNAVLRTGWGRAEVLLGPCSAMWVEQQSALRMVSSALSDVRLTVLRGSVIIATGEMMKGTKVTVVLTEAVAPLEARGAYRFDAEPARIKVLSGKPTSVQWENRVIPLNAGRLLLLDSGAEAARFDRRNSDFFENWSIGRAEYLEDLSGRQAREARGPADIVLRGTPNVGGPGPIQTVPQPATVPPAAACTVSGW